jgi:hypothetical protein
VVPDPDGGFTQGIDTLGRFADRWEPGAVRHFFGGRASYPWFLPVDPDDRHAAYRRACDYGDGWAYVGLVVRAGRSGVTLSEAALWGLESDAGEDVLSETALELAEEALVHAHLTLRTLCPGPEAAREGAIVP